MKDQPLFSIIIPTHNRGDLLMKGIRSILDQGVNDWELLIVDDGSTDNTRMLVEALEDRRLRYFYQENQGQSAARNYGVAKSKGAFILFMDDDDRWLEGHLRLFKRAIEKRDPSDKRIYRTGFIRIRPDGTRIKAPNYDSRKHVNPVRFATFRMCGLWTLCIPKAFLLENSSPVGFPHWQDTHLILRLLAQYPFEQLEGYTYQYVLHDKMGSLKNQGADTIYRRAMINVAAFEDLFANYGALIRPFVPAGTLDFLTAKKLLEYANLELAIGNRKKHWKLLRKSLSHKISWRLWKHYLLFFKYLF